MRRSKSIDTLLPNLLPEGDFDRRLLRRRYGAVFGKDVLPVVGIQPSAASRTGWFPTVNNAAEARSVGEAPPPGLADSSPRRALEDEKKQCILVLDRRDAGGPRYELVGFTDGASRGSAHDWRDLLLSWT
jgi:hypothetical protein